MPQTPRTSRTALLTAAITCLIPVLALAAQQAPTAPPATVAPAATPATTPSPAARPPMDPRASEKGLGLTDPANPNLPSLILIGDSTVRNGHGTGSDGLWGWGHPIHDFFDPGKINVVNHAIGGLSSHSYISGGHWDLALEIIKPGDFVLIQWGHNDGGINLSPARNPSPTPDFPPAQLLPRRLPARHRGKTSAAASPASAKKPSTSPTPAPAPSRPSTPTAAGICRKYIADVEGQGRHAHHLLASFRAKSGTANTSFARMPTYIAAGPSRCRRAAARRLRRSPTSTIARRCDTMGTAAGRRCPR